MRRLLGGRRGIGLVIAVCTVLAVVLVPSAVTQAANGSLYLSQATDPHGEVWLGGALGGHLWVASTLGPDRGLAQVKVDGRLVATVDLYAPQQIAAQVAWAINGLMPGVTHQVQIVSTGTRNASATAARVDYDAILALK